MVPVFSATGAGSNGERGGLGLWGSNGDLSCAAAGPGLGWLPALANGLAAGAKGLSGRLGAGRLPADAKAAKGDGMLLRSQQVPHGLPNQGSGPKIIDTNPE